MNIFTSKRADVAPFFWVFSIIRILSVFIFILALYLLISAFIKEEVDVFYAESNLFIERILTQPNGISYTDPLTTRTYPYVLDIKRIKNPDLSTSLEQSNFYGDTNKHIAAELILEDSLGNVLTQTYYNEDWYDRWIVLARLHVPGPGGARLLTRRIPVLIHDETQLTIMDLEKKATTLVSEKTIDTASLNDLNSRIERLETQSHGKLASGVIQITVVMPNS